MAAGLLLGMGAWTRPEGGAFGLAIVGVAGILMLVIRSRARVLAGTATPFLAIWWPWLSFGANYQSADEVGTVLRALAGRLPLEGVRWEVVGTYIEYIAARLLEPSTWGVLLGTAVVLFVAGMSAGRSHRLPPSGSKSKAISILCSAVVLVCLAMVGLGYYHYESSVMLTDTFDRAFLPAAILMWTAVVAWAAPRLGSGAGEFITPARVAEPIEGRTQPIGIELISNGRDGGTGGLPAATRVPGA